MSARKSDKLSFAPVIVEAGQVHLSLTPEDVCIRKHGVEFFSPTPLAKWMEMTIKLESRRDGHEITCAGVVVACDGNRHAGYVVSLLFTGLSDQAQSALAQLAHSPLA